MTDGPLTFGERTQIARVMWEWFQALRAAGFDEKTAIRVCVAMIGDVL